MPKALRQRAKIYVINDLLFFRKKTKSTTLVCEKKA